MTPQMAAPVGIADSVQVGRQALRLMADELEIRPPWDALSVGVLSIGALCSIGVTGAVRDEKLALVNALFWLMSTTALFLGTRTNRVILPALSVFVLLAVSRVLLSFGFAPPSTLLLILLSLALLIFASLVGGICVRLNHRLGLALRNVGIDLRH